MYEGKISHVQRHFRQRIIISRHLQWGHFVSQLLLLEAAVVGKGSSLGCIFTHQRPTKLRSCYFLWRPFDNKPVCQHRAPPDNKPAPLPKDRNQINKHANENTGLLPIDHAAPLHNKTSSPTSKRVRFCPRRRLRAVSLKAF